MLAAVCVGGATFHVVHAGVADLPAIGGQMFVVMGHHHCKGAQQSCGIALAVQPTLLVLLVDMGELSNTSFLRSV